MTSPSHILIVGAGAAGLMAGRELAHAGTRVTILEARDRLGGRITSLPVEDFGYPAEGGAEFVHGEAPVTRDLLREFGLSLAPMDGVRWDARKDKVSEDEAPGPDDNRFHDAVMALETDMPIAEFLDTQFGGPRYATMRQSILRMVEGYDAADPSRASTFALREEWMGEGLEQQGRIAEGYGALIDCLAEDCRKHGATMHLDAAVNAIDTKDGRPIIRCSDGRSCEADAVILTVPLPILSAIRLPPALNSKLAAAADIGFGNVVKILLRFKTRFWTKHHDKDLSDLSFLFGDATVPTWWTQRPEDHPVLTGWFAGPKADTVAGLSEEALIDMGLASLAKIFDLSLDVLKKDAAAARAINWGNDPFARGAYSYATPQTRAAQAMLEKPDGTNIVFSGEALYAGRDMGTVEAALASGRDAARILCWATDNQILPSQSRVCRCKPPSKCATRTSLNA